MGDSPLHGSRTPIATVNSRTNKVGRRHEILNACFNRPTRLPQAKQKCIVGSAYPIISLRAIPFNKKLVTYPLESLVASSPITSDFWEPRHRLLRRLLPRNDEAVPPPILSHPKLHRLQARNSGCGDPSVAVEHTVRADSCFKGKLNNLNSPSKWQMPGHHHHRYRPREQWKGIRTRKALRSEPSIYELRVEDLDGRRTDGGRKAETCDGRHGLLCRPEPGDDRETLFSPLTWRHHEPRDVR